MLSSRVERGGPQTIVASKTFCPPRTNFCPFEGNVNPSENACFYVIPYVKMLYNSMW